MSQKLIDAIRASDPTANAIYEVKKAVLEDGETMGLVLSLAPLNPDSVAAQSIVKSLKLAELKEAAKLPKIATINGRAVNLNWQENFHLDGWFAEIDPEIVRELEEKRVNMNAVIDELGRYGDFSRYIKDSFGETYLCIYKDAV